MRVYSPTWGAGADGAGADDGAGGKPEADGRCGPAAAPGGGALKNRVNSPGWEEGAGTVANPPAGSEDWNSGSNSPGFLDCAAGAGQSPWAGAEGSGDWNTRVNSPGPVEAGAGGAAGSGTLRNGDWNMRVNSPGGAAETGGAGSGCNAGGAGD